VASDGGGHSGGLVQSSVCFNGDCQVKRSAMRSTGSHSDSAWSDGVVGTIEDFVRKHVEYNLIVDISLHAWPA
jgi:hypothetical protein